MATRTLGNKKRFSNTYDNYTFFRFGLVLWHIKHCRLFNSKSFLCTYIKYITKHILEITFLNETELIYLHIVKWFHLFLSNTNYLIYLLTGKYLQLLLFNSNKSVKHQSFVYSQLNYKTVLLQTIQFSISQQN